MNQQECIWMNKKSNGQVDIGFQQTYITEHLQEAFHILPANHNKIEKGAPMMGVESNEGLENIRSPFAGRFVNFSDKARNFPDRLKETDVVLTLLTEEEHQKKLEQAKKEVKDKPAKAKVVDNYVAQGMEAGVMIHDDVFNRPFVGNAQIDNNNQAAQRPVRWREPERPGRMPVNAQGMPTQPGFFGQTQGDFIFDGLNWIRWQTVNAGPQVREQQPDLDQW